MSRVASGTSSVASRSQASSSRVGSSVSGITSGVSGVSASNISNINSTAVSGFTSAINVYRNIQGDKKILKKVIPYDISFMQQMLNIFNLLGFIVGLIILAYVSSGLMSALNENCLRQPYNQDIKPLKIEPRGAESYRCTGNRLIKKSEIVPKFNFLLIIAGLFFAVQAKLFGFMGSAFLVSKHQILYILCFIFAYILLGISSLIEFGTKYRRQLFTYFQLPAWSGAALVPYAIVEVCMLIATLRLILRWNQFLRGQG